MRFVVFFFAAFSAIAGQFSTALGDQYPYVISAITTDTAGNTYAVGVRQLSYSNQPLGNTPSTPEDVFVTKLDPNGNVLFTRAFDTDGATTPHAIAVDSSGNIYIAGNTTSDDFPVTNALQPNPCSCGFILKLTGNGATILYATYFGGLLGGTAIAAIAVDPNGNLYLTGSTDASDFPHTPGMPFGPIQANQSTGTYIDGAFVTEISAAGDKILYSGAFSNTATTLCIPDYLMSFCQSNSEGTAISLDPAGSAYIVGYTDAPNLATPGVLVPSIPDLLGSPFLAKISAGGTGIGYLTYLNASPNALAVDASGDAYIGGYSGANYRATTGAYQTGFIGGSYDGLVIKVNPTASAIIWATYLGGGNGGGSAAVVYSLALDPSGNVWTTGLAAEGTIPNPNGWANGEAFVTALNPAGSALVYSALYPRGIAGQFLAVDGTGLVHFAWPNGLVSVFSPTAGPPMSVFGLQNAFGGYVAQRVAPAEVIAIYGPGIGPANAVTATPSNGFYPTTLGGVQVSIGGVNAPLLYVSANQINAVAPMEATIGSGATVQVTNGASSAQFPVWIIGIAPQAYSGVLNQDGTLNSQTNPAKSGSIATFYATGLQTNFAPLADGQIATAALDLCGGACASTNGTVLYGGAAPDLVAGVSQFNVQLGTSTGLTTLVVSDAVWTSEALSVSVWVAP
ncbi:MAG TPA: SBBP repeat-containing protein [Bryobacteraceae bacterium]|nr:SBBP repeat-containing protein [Bryobacteraceae bacterium]